MPVIECFLLSKRGRNVKVTFEDNSEEVIAAMEAAVVKGLEECGLVAEDYEKRLCDGFKHPTGNLRNSITHTAAPDEKVMCVGTDSEYAIYVECGTGIYYPGGRQDAWACKDGEGNWHMTHGQRAHPYIKPAVADHQKQYLDIIQRELNGK